MEELQIWLKSETNMYGGIKDLAEIGKKFGNSKRRPH
jgi:hypothetical protein